MTNDPATPVYVILPLTAVNELRTKLKKALFEAAQIAHVHRARECIEDTLRALIDALPDAKSFETGAVRLAQPPKPVAKPNHIPAPNDSGTELTSEQVQSMLGNVG